MANSITSGVGLLLEVAERSNFLVDRDLREVFLDVVGESGSSGLSWLAEPARRFEPVLAADPSVFRGLAPPPRPFLTTSDCCPPVCPGPSCSTEAAVANEVLGSSDGKSWTIWDSEVDVA